MITSGAKTSGKSDKFLKGLVKRLGGDTDILVGVPKNAEPYSKKGSSTIPVATVAAMHEFGTGGQEERSFLRSSFDEHQKKYIKMAQKLVKKVVEKGGTIEKVAALIGQEAEFDVVDKINAISTPGNADSTIARKGFDNPLIETGKLKQSIRFEVRTEKS